MYKILGVVLVVILSTYAQAQQPPIVPLNKEFNVGKSIEIIYNLTKFDLNLELLPTTITSLTFGCFEAKIVCLYFVQHMVIR
ncbi:unnamed protein product [Bursaphelenchus okinawaensis]|uniref:Uncharacterized protein n=1 Tax=Bursaphelenchus okinawaensis TaxID=465554 RepID=A0A811KRJ2_9BILA|nr:unnamed protein product [Bursaphelenchus okinawaensis]CAG9108203.1 unnamed protein product [Bursaphelenchus okinawaensis]